MDRRRFIGGIAGSLALAGCGGGSDAPASIPGDASPSGGLVRRMVVYDHEEVREATAMGQEIRSRRDGDDPSYRFLTSRKWGEA